jgi:hypothetical protein
MTDLSQEYIDIIKTAGYRVFVRNVTDPTYCFYTDGERIAYAQWARFKSGVSSVHKPCQSAGTGFAVADTISNEALKCALHCFVPAWAYGVKYTEVKKYANMTAFLNASDWNSKLVEV